MEAFALAWILIHSSEYSLGSLLDPGLMMLFILIFSLLYFLNIIRAIRPTGIFSVVNEVKCFVKLINMEMY